MFLGNLAKILRSADLTPISPVFPLFQSKTVTGPGSFQSSQIGSFATLQRATSWRFSAHL